MVIAAFISAIIWDRNTAIAQINPDTTLRQNSTVTTNSNIINIQGGTQAGNNLFHSFQDFSISTGNTAYFNHAPNIQNIISRVTGQSISNIDGLIRANGAANLFLINPNGIIFGENARLDVGGSFIASTASSVKFADNVEFSAKNPQSAPLLSINLPIGLQFERNPGSIQLKGNGETSSFTIDTDNALRVQDNQTLALVGGDLIIEGAALRNIGGRIELGSVAGSGLVSITPNNPGFALGYDLVQNFGNIDISQQAGIIVSGTDIQVQGERVTLTDDSRLEAYTISEDAASITIKTNDLLIQNGAQVGTSTLGAGKGGNITVTADSVNITGTSTSDVPSVLFTSSVDNATGDAGDLTINTRDLLIQNGAFVTVGTSSAGNGGNVTVNADSVNITGTSTSNVPSALLTSSVGNATGDAGDLTINTRNLLIQNGAFITVGTSSAGNGGNVTVNADSVNITGTSTDGYASLLVATSERNATGDAGDLTINTRDLLIQNGAQVATGTFSAGNGGNLTITAESVNISGTFINGFPTGLFTSSQPSATGDAGDLTINTRDLLIQNGAQVSVGTFSAGKGGNFTVNADLVNITGTSTDGFASLLFAISDTNATGDAGNLTINTRDLLIQNGAQVSVGTFSAGNGGNLTITAESVNITGASTSNSTTGLFTSSERNATGNAGDLTINTRDLLIQNGAQVNVGTSGAGKGGNLSVTAESVNLTGTSQLSATSGADATGDAGNLTINTRDLLITDPGGVFVSSLGRGNAGNIDINASFISLNNQGKINADTSGGGGNIFLRSPLVILRNQSAITTNATGENIPGGNITIDATDGFIVAVPQENSDISANSAESRGGQVIINAESIFGIQPRNTPTELSDITATGASPDLSGSIQIIIRDTNSNQGLINLPNQPVEIKIAQGCQVSASQNQSSFVVTGRGGLPQNPREVFHSDQVELDWATLNPKDNNRDAQTVTINSHIPQPVKIVEATGWKTIIQGEILLIDSSTNLTAQNQEQQPATCAVSK
ncbi:two-partner secretion domain-containing protein [Cylindrospermum sp. FACHB-282]|uniref:two-partner secretion domain-containing protein n=1 Tax=Cylindrospermum sp. FACHB-282 TaxID=2692794 RepID=UPI0016845BF7|nr:S-layer family protein [Cylindrospermum sp. FACHB-282]MBD2387077.1 S-layer family protein [Cylindrospermum sp. FACHB-282]